MSIELLLALSVCALAVADLILWCIFMPLRSRGWLRLLPGSGFFYYIQTLRN